MRFSVSFVVGGLGKMGDVTMSLPGDYESRDAAEATMWAWLGEEVQHVEQRMPGNKKTSTLIFKARTVTGFLLTETR